MNRAVKARILLSGTGLAVWCLSAAGPRDSVLAPKKRSVSVSGCCAAVRESCLCCGASSRLPSPPSAFREVSPSSCRWRARMCPVAIIPDMSRVQNCLIQAEKAPGDPIAAAQPCPWGKPEDKRQRENKSADHQSLLLAVRDACSSRAACWHGSRHSKLLCRSPVCARRQLSPCPC